MSGYGTTGQVQVSSGIAFALGANMETDPNNPSLVTDSANTPLSTFYYLYRNADGSYKTNPTTSTIVNFGNYDNGSGTLAGVSANRWSIQRVYKIPGTSVVYVYYGRDTYGTDTAAIAAILSESFDEVGITRYNGVFLGWLIVRGAGTNVGNTSDCRIIPGGFFRNTTGGGGAATVANLDDLGDVAVTTPANNQILRYDSTQGLWINSPASAVAVSSVNGLTGDISSIAVTGSNTFTGLQTMNAGITANNLWVTNGATFAARSTFVNGLSADTLWATNGVTFSSNLYAGTIKGGQLNVQNTGNNLLGDVVGALGGGYIQVDNSSGVAVNRIAGTVYTDQIRAGGAVSVTGAISASTTITATGRMSNAGMTATGAVAFTSSVTANNLYVSQGVTFNSTSVHTGLATFNAGITSNNLWVTNGATFAGTVSSDTGYRISSSAVNTQTGTTYSLTASDNGKIITMNNGATSTVTVIGGLPVGFNTTVIQLGAGAVGFTAASGVTLNSFASSYTMAGQHGAATVIAYATNILNLSGTLTV